MLYIYIYIALYIYISRGALTTDENESVRSVPPFVTHSTSLACCSTPTSSSSSSQSEPHPVLFSFLCAFDGKTIILCTFEGHNFPGNGVLLMVREGPPLRRAARHVAVELKELMAYIPQHETCIRHGFQGIFEPGYRENLPLSGPTFDRCRTRI